MAQLEKTVIATRGKQAEKRRTATRGNKLQTPQDQRKDKPPRVGNNIEWIQKGVGWDCREIYYVGKTRRRRHISHLGQETFARMRAEYPDDAALNQRLLDWIEERKFEKGLSEVGQIEQRPVM